MNDISLVVTDRLIEIISSSLGGVPLMEKHHPGFIGGLRFAIGLDIGERRFTKLWYFPKETGGERVLSSPPSKKCQIRPEQEEGDKEAATLQHHDSVP